VNGQTKGKIVEATSAECNQVPFDYTMMLTLIAQTLFRMIVIGYTLPNEGQVDEKYARI
jgi:hypothetical protein